MIELKIDDAEIENYFDSVEDIIALLKAVVHKKVEIVQVIKKEKLELEKIIEVVSSYFSDKPILTAYLFGSYSRGDETEDSDIDILVELDYNTKSGSYFFKMSDELEELLGKKVDLLSSKAATENVKKEILKDRIKIYEKAKYFTC